jgi:hypothetical protein
MLASLRIKRKPIRLKTETQIGASGRFSNEYQGVRLAVKIQLVNAKIRLYIIEEKGERDNSFLEMKLVFERSEKTSFISKNESGSKVLLRQK